MGTGTPGVKKCVGYQLSCTSNKSMAPVWTAEALHVLPGTLFALIAIHIPVSTHGQPHSQHTDVAQSSPGRLSTLLCHSVGLQPAILPLQA